MTKNLTFFCIPYPPYRREVGWGCGYVAIPAQRLKGRDLSQCICDKDIHINQALTLEEIASDLGPTYWEAAAEYGHALQPDDLVVGFDTGHTFSNPHTHNEEWVYLETCKLAGHIYNATREDEDEDEDEPTVMEKVEAKAKELGLEGWYHLNEYNDHIFYCYSGRRYVVDEEDLTFLDDDTYPFGQPLTN